MVRSMTAFGQSRVDSLLGQWLVEIHSVNRKTLDLSIYLPKELLRFEVGIRKWVAGFISRGQVTVRVRPPASINPQVSVAALARLKAFWGGAAQELGFDPLKEISLNFLVQQLNSASQENLFENDGEIEEVLQQGMIAALKEHQQMREREGAALEKDIRSRLSMIDVALQKISIYRIDVIAKYRHKLEEKVKEWLPKNGDLETRMMQEVLFLVEKSDITEEIVRLDSHLKQFDTILKESESIGRKLDFLTQEMNREINTIASKATIAANAADLEVIQQALIIKSEIEKIREQVQNIE